MKFLILSLMAFTSFEAFSGLKRVEPRQDTKTNSDRTLSEDCYNLLSGKGKTSLSKKRDGRRCTTLLLDERDALIKEMNEKLQSPRYQKLRRLDKKEIYVPNDIPMS